MADELSFDDLMARVRTGDGQAAEQLVRQYERAIRVAVRVRLTDANLRRQFDSMDVCQSVLASFFVRAAAGQFDLESPQQLVGLLVKMAQNKFGMRARHHRASKRDGRRDEVVGDAAMHVSDGTPGPEARAVSRELLDQLLERLDNDERELAQRRACGQSWNDIAVDLGGTPQGHRMKLSRALDRVAPELGLE